MLTENYIAATQAANKPSAHLSSTLKDVGIFFEEFQPQSIFRHGYKKSSVKSNGIAISDSHIFAAQADKAVIHVYNRDKGNQEATVAFPNKIHSLAYAQKACILIIGTDDGKLLLWEVVTGRVTISAASHLESVTTLDITWNNDYVLSGSSESNIHVWSLSQLVTFPSATQLYDDEPNENGPSRTFSQHRSAVTALATGHSCSNTNFAVSAAADQTCYLWHIESCQVLRTFLTPSVSVSITLDPVDRAIYLGNEDGSIQSIDLFGDSKRSIYANTSAAPLQLSTKTSWSAPSSDLGAAQCLTLSYDGTTLLSGHAGGTIVRWDVAKRRIVSEVTNLHQPVTNIQMLTPDGLRDTGPPFNTPTIVKPRLELSTESTENTVGLPNSYSLHVQIARDPPNSKPTSSSQRNADAILSGGLFPDDMLNDAILAMTTTPAAPPATASNEKSNRENHYKIQALEEDKALLEKKLAVMQKLHYDAQDRHRKRSAKREQLGRQRREAYLVASKSQHRNKGKKKEEDAEGILKKFDRLIDEVDRESDEEELRIGEGLEEGVGEEMDVDEDEK